MREYRELDYAMTLEMQHNVCETKT